MIADRNLDPSKEINNTRNDINDFIYFLFVIALKDDCLKQK